MQSNSNIYIFSAPVQSGKTSLLMNWVNSQKSVCGILTPDIEGKRKLFDIATKTYFDFETENNSSAEEIISVGRFHFFKKVFDRAQKILLQSLNQKPEWLIVDEVGKLEWFEQKCLEPVITYLIEHYKNKNSTGKLLLIIRDTLLNECIAHYGLENAMILNRDYFSSQLQNDLCGLVVCGGESSRMGMDKSLINYHGKPQRYYLYELMQSFCEKVFISCNQSQIKDMEAGYEIIVDPPHYQNIGPMAALLSAFEKYSEKSFLVIGCDYPFVGKVEMQTLINSRDKNVIALCYQNNELIAEPLLALYENKTFQLLKNNFSQDKYSLRYFLEENNAKKVFTKDDKVLKSVDTKEEYLVALRKTKL